MRTYSQRDIELHTAKVLLAEAMNRRAAGNSHAMLLRWAGNARKRAMAIDTSPPQADMFAVASQERQSP